jgi:hypothetical protein
MRVSAIKHTVYVPLPTNPEIKVAETQIERIPTPKEMGFQETMRFMKAGSTIDIMV